MGEREKTLKKFAYEVLSEIEKQEMKLLAWGFYDTQFNLQQDLPPLITEERLDTPLWKALLAQTKANNISVQEAINLLCKEQLLVDVAGSDPSTKRSKFAEVLRLLARLKQRFSDGDWLSAPNLVLDIRPEIRQREYPNRDVGVKRALELLKERGVALSPAEAEIFRCLLEEGTKDELMLSRFQMDSIATILKGQARGVVVGAGTGSGKTKAFYIPALIRIAPLTNLRQRWTKIIAVYPRVELLKDQVRECLSECKKLTEGFYGEDDAILRIGVLYGDTPSTHDDEARLRKWQTHGGEAFVCPMMKCPRSGCGGDLIWRMIDIEKKRDRLRCSLCKHTISDEEIVLTRQGMLDEPPDILFTTTEMLNRLLGRSDAKQLLGIENKWGQPLFLLLDEIHSYQGVFGAHVAYLIRRWRHASDNDKCTIVGLSATLRNAKRFMAEITGLPEYQISYISPSQEEMAQEGMEYNIALRGDPASATSLLSTTIQTSMLLARIMNPSNVDPPLSEAYGKKIFAFADRLDTINRWRYDFLDAEQTKRLAKYRRSSGNMAADFRRDQQGQLWKLCENTGFDLLNPLDIDSISSLDPGLRGEAQVVIATASLEVGYDDVGVGGVVQHKSPRNQASFIQRRGRGGRLRGMRPWTVLVLSDYGKDRWVFEHSEQIMSPELAPLYLPLSNRYILRIQAGYAFLDWLSLEGKSRNAWKAAEGFGARNDLIATIRSILADPTSKERASIVQHIKRALQIDEEALLAVLWGEPRSIMLGFLPTLWRRLSSGWHNENDSSTPDTKRDNQPMPDYLPKNLFSDLCLPEVEVCIPNSSETRQMPIQQALVEYAPGKVSKRYTPRDDLATSHWVSIHQALLEGATSFTTDEAFPEPFQRAGKIQIGDETIPYYRPQRIKLRATEEGVKDYSNAALEWVSRFMPGGAEPRDVFLPKFEFVSHFISSIQAFLGGNGSSVEVSRVAVACRYEARIKREGYRGTLTFKRMLPEVDRIGIGYNLSVDGLKVALKVPGEEEIRGLLSHPSRSGTHQRLRPAFLKHLMLKNSRLSEEANSFAIDWLWQCELTAIASLALQGGEKVESAIGELASGGRQEAYERVLEAILKARGDEEEGEEPRLKRQLSQILSTRGVEAEIDAMARKALVDPLGEEFFQWCRLRLLDTLRNALWQASLELVPHATEQDLIADLQGGDVWVTETSVGSVGIVQELADKIFADPHLFAAAFEKSASACSQDFLASQLLTFVQDLSSEGSALKAAARGIRGTAASSLKGLQDALGLLITETDKAGISLERQVIAAINAHVLRPGSTEKYDALLKDLHEAWSETKSTLGIDVDARVFAYHAAEVFGSRLESIWGEAIPENQKFNMVRDMLFERCFDSCPYCLDLYHPFSPRAEPSRDLLQVVLQPTKSTVAWTASQECDEAVEGCLRSRGEAQIFVNKDFIGDFQKWLFSRLSRPVEAGYQLFYPTVAEVQRDGPLWKITLLLKDYVNA